MIVITDSYPNQKCHKRRTCLSRECRCGVCASPGFSPRMTGHDPVIISFLVTKADSPPPSWTVAAVLSRLKVTAPQSSVGYQPRSVQSDLTLESSSRGFMYSF